MFESKMFYKETEFKDNILGKKIPKDWEKVRIKEIVKFRKGRNPSIIKSEGEIPVFGAEGLIGYTDKHLVENDYILVIGKVEKICKVHLCCGKVWVGKDAIYSQKYDKQKIYLPFLYYVLLNLLKESHIDIHTRSLGDLYIPLPAVEEQKAIVNVFSMVDKAIEIENNIIAKLEKLRGSLTPLLYGKIRIKL